MLRHAILTWSRLATNRISFQCLKCRRLELNLIPQQPKASRNPRVNNMPKHTHTVHFRHTVQQSQLYSKRKWLHYISRDKGSCEIPRAPSVFGANACDPWKFGSGAMLSIPMLSLDTMSIESHVNDRSRIYVGEAGETGMQGADNTFRKYSSQPNVGALQRIVRHFVQCYRNRFSRGSLSTSCITSCLSTVFESASTHRTCR